MSPLLIFQTLTGLCLVGCLFALWKGGTAERLAAGVIVGNMVLGFLTMVLANNLVEPFRLINDGLAAAVLLVLAVRYAAPWLGGAMLLYALQFGLHSYFLVLGLPNRSPVHVLINNVDFLSIIGCLVIGTAMAWRRRVAAEREPDPFPEDAALQAAP